MRQTSQEVEPKGDGEAAGHKPAPTGEALLEKDLGRAPGEAPRVRFVRKHFCFEDRVASIYPFGIGANQPGWAEFEAARSARAGARWLKDSHRKGTATLLLERSQVHLLLRAVLELHGHRCKSSYITEADWTAASRIEPVAALLANLPADALSALKACFGENAELWLIGLDAKQRRVVSSSLRKTNEILGDPLDLHEKLVSRTRTARWLLIGSGIVFAVALIASGKIGMYSLRHRIDLALHRPVTASSHASFENVSESRLVDGDRSHLGLHTNYEPNPFAIIDLGASKRFDKVVVYNRTDCCQDRSIPLFIDVSNDGVKFDNIAERTEPFEKWTEAGLDAKGRYVRLRLNSSNYLHLSEVEIY